MLGLDPAGGENQLSDEFIGQVVEAVRPHRSDGHGAAWRTLVAHHDEITAWVEDDLTAVKIHELLERRGIEVPLRTLQRYVVQACGRTKSQGPTVRVVDGEPGDELQVDFGRMGKLFDPETSRTRICWALLFTACYSRHQFLWLTFRQTTEAVIEGFEAAWGFFDGVFRTVIPDNMSAVVEDADSIEPRLNQAFVEYAQARGFHVDPTRVRHPKDKPKVERAVPFARGSFFAGERFIDLPDAQRRAEQWCRVRAGLRVHGTTQQRPAEVFADEELARLLLAPTEAYDLPLYSKPKVHRDHHVEVAKALYSVPGTLIGSRLDARADRALVRIFHRGQLVKVHPPMPAGKRSTDPADLPSHKTAYAMRDLELLQRMAAGHGEAIGAYAAALLDTPLPWTKMRQVYALLGLVRKWGDEAVDAACRSALDHEVVNVGLIGRMLDRGSEGTAPPPAPVATVVPARFARDRPLRPSGVGSPAPRYRPAPLRAAEGHTAAGFGADVAGEAR